MRRYLGSQSVGENSADSKVCLALGLFPGPAVSVLRRLHSLFGTCLAPKVRDKDYEGCVEYVCSLERGKFNQTGLVDAFTDVRN